MAYLHPYCWFFTFDSHSEPLQTKALEVSELQERLGTQGDLAALLRRVQYDVPAQGREHDPTIDGPAAASMVATVLRARASGDLEAEVSAFVDGLFTIPAAAIAGSAGNAVVHALKAANLIDRSHLDDEAACEQLAGELLLVLRLAIDNLGVIAAFLQASIEPDYDRLIALYHLISSARLLSQVAFGLVAAAADRSGNDRAVAVEDFPSRLAVAGVAAPGGNKNSTFLVLFLWCLGSTGMR